MLTPNNDRTRERSSAALLGVPVLDALALGPNVGELKETVRKLADPKNSDALAIVANVNPEELEWVAYVDSLSDEADSALRELTIDLFINGASITEAVATARRTLQL